MTKEIDKRIICVLRLFCIRFFIFSSNLLLRVLLIIYRGGFFCMEHIIELELIFKILDIMWDLCKKLFA